MDKPYWLDGDAAWWAKLRRARVHIQAVRDAVAAFENGRPWRVECEPGPRPNELAYRRRVDRPIPVDLATIVGDAIHNMRSAMDAVAYELARRHVGGELNDEQATAPTFPICPDAAEFDEFFDQHRQRRGLYGTVERRALRCVQPFALTEEAAELGIEDDGSSHLQLVSNDLYRLHHLSNIDKHRRLSHLSWSLAIVYWTTSPGEDERTYQWRPAPARVYEDGTLLGHLVRVGGDASPSAQMFHEMRLALLEDPAHRGDPSDHQGVADVLAGWLRSLSGWVVPRVFIVAESGGRPPILIPGFPIPE